MVDFSVFLLSLFRFPSLSAGSESLRPLSHGAGDARAHASCAGPPALIDSFHMTWAETTSRAYIFIFITSFYRQFPFGIVKTVC